MREELAARLLDAERNRVPCQALTETDADLSIDDAYAIQQVNLDCKVAEGDRLVGRKIGLTSRAVQEWLGVDEPDFGGLLSSMAVPDGGEISVRRLLQPRVEGELAFVLKRDLWGPGVTPHDVIGAIDFVLPSIEIIDSRIQDWKFKIQDTIADNASSGLFVTGSRPTPLGSFDTRSIGMTLRKNGRVVSTGAGAACLGDPIAAVVWLANRLGTLGTTLEAGQVILSGALGPVVPVTEGDTITVDIGRLGTTSVSFFE